MSPFVLFAKNTGKAAMLFLLAMATTQSFAQTAIDPKAAALLKAATDFLGQQEQFSVDTRNSIEVVLKSGQKIQFDHTATQSVQRPNKMRVARSGDLVNQLFVYDGKTLVLTNPTQKVYASVAAPPTLEETLDFARTKLDIVAPAGDVLYKNAYDILMTDVKSGFVVGKGLVEGASCDHLAFSAPHVDLQIWIEDGKQPLIRKFIITTKDVENAPQFSVVTTKWNLKPKFDSKTFVFTPAKGVQKIDFVAPR